jgi:hypothetical protein
MTTTPDFPDFPDFRALAQQLAAQLRNAMDFTISSETYEYMAALIERTNAALATPPGPPKNCWLVGDEPDLSSHCVFDDPSEVISNCTYAQTVKCKTDCQYYRAATPPPESGKVAAWMYQGEPDFDGIRWRENWEVTIDEKLAHFKSDNKEPIPLFQAHDLAPPPAPPTDEELMALAVAVFEDPYATDKDYARAVLERWGK